MHFGVHFPKENVQRTFSKGKCSAYIFLWKMFSVHFPLENVQHQQNVTNAFDAKMHLMRCKNAFLHQMHLMPKCILAYIFQRKMFSVHFPKENVQRTFSFGKCSANQNVRKRAAQKTPNTAFDAKMYL